jgi:hypothetical protein
MEETVVEEDPSKNIPVSPSNVKVERPEVIIIRNWKEYLGEGALIIFSVMLALLLTEVFTKMHEDRQTKEVLHELRQELIANMESERIQYRYHLQVLGNIDSALRHVAFRKRFLDSGVLHLNAIAPDGVKLRDLNDIAWQVAKQNNIFSKISLQTYSLLTDIYDNQQLISKSEDEIGRLLLSFESRKPENTITTLILVRDSYHGWSVDRAPSLLERYKIAIDALKDY